MTVIRLFQPFKGVFLVIEIGVHRRNVVRRNEPRFLTQEQLAKDRTGLFRSAGGYQDSGETHVRPCLVRRKAFCRSGFCYSCVILLPPAIYSGGHHMGEGIVAIEVERVQDLLQRLVRVPVGASYPRREEWLKRLQLKGAVFLALP